MRKNIHYGWVILFLTFFTLLFVQGVRLSFGAFIEPWEETFLSTRAEITAVSLVSYLVFAVMQPLVGKFIDTVGVKKVLAASIVVVGLALVLTTFATQPWQLMILYGVVASIGFGGASNVTGTMVVAKWFTKKKGLAMGIMSAGTASGQFMIVPISIMLIEAIGWTRTIFALGLILLVLMLPLILFLFVSSPEAKGTTPFGGVAPELEATVITHGASASNSVMAHLFQRPFLFLMLPFFVCGFTTSGLIDTHLVPFAQYCGFSAAFAGTAVSVLALFNFSGTIISGYFSDKWDCRKMLGVLYGVRAFTIILLLAIIHEPTLFGFVINQSYLLILFSISFGIVDFSTVAPTMKLASDYFSKASIGFIIGMLFFAHQVGAALGSFVPGLLFDLFGGYDSSFIFSIILCVAASLMSFLLPKVKVSTT